MFWKICILKNSLRMEMYRRNWYQCVWNVTLKFGDLNVSNSKYVVDMNFSHGLCYTLFHCDDMWWWNIVILFVLWFGYVWGCPTFGIVESLCLWTAFMVVILTSLFVWEVDLSTWGTIVMVPKGVKIVNVISSCFMWGDDLQSQRPNKGDVYNKDMQKERKGQRNKKRM